MIATKDSIFKAFRVGPAASGQLNHFKPLSLAAGPRRNEENMESLLIAFLTRSFSDDDEKFI